MRIFIAMAILFLPTIISVPFYTHFFWDNFIVIGLTAISCFTIQVIWINLVADFLEQIFHIQ